MNDETPAARCPACYERVPADRAAVCLHCKAVYHEACRAGPCVVAGCRPPVAPGEPERKSPGWKVRLFELTIAILMIAVLVPNFKASRPHNPRRSCYANQKTIVGAMEMYNLDNNTKRTVLDASFFVSLKSGGYLQSIPQDPGQGPGTSGNYQATGTGNGMTCNVHGPIQ